MPPHVGVIEEDRDDDDPGGDGTFYQDCDREPEPEAVSQEEFDPAKPAGVPYTFVTA